MMGVWILLSFVAGVLFGTVVMALCQVSKIEEDKRMSERESEDRMTNEQALIFLELNCLATSQDQKEMKVEAVRTLRALIKEGIYDERTNETCD